MKIRAVLLAATIFYFNSAAFAQDPLKVAPQAYRLQFENEWVKVTRVHYGPRAKVHVHDHSRWPAAYVYLNDYGPVIFRHTDWEHPVLTRPAVKAGSFRLSPTTAVNETHEVENTTDTPSDFLRIEFKTRPAGRRTLRGRFPPAPYPAGENFRKVEFENEQVRVTRLVCAPRRSLAVAANPSEPALLVVLSSARVKSAGAAGAASQTTFAPGETVWLAGGGERRLENLGGTPLELLRFDFKTAP